MGIVRPSDLTGFEVDELVGCSTERWPVWRLENRADLNAVLAARFSGSASPRRLPATKSASSGFGDPQLREVPAR
jgi:hypothetical protein